MDFLVPTVNLPEQTEVAVATTIDLTDDKEDTPAEQTANTPMEDRKRDLETDVQASASEAAQQSPVKKRRTETGEIKEETKDNESSSDPDDTSSDESAPEEEPIVQKNLLEMASEDKMPKMSEKEAADFAQQLQFEERFAPLDEALANSDESIQHLEAAIKALKPQAENDERDYMKHVDTMDGLRKQRLSLAERNSELEEKIADAHTERSNAESKHLANESRMHGYLSQIRKQRETIKRLEKERGALEHRLRDQFLREQGAGKVLFQSNDPEEEAI